MKSMPDNVVSISESQMLWEWARVEIDSPRFRHGYDSILASVKSLVVANKPEALSDQEREQVISTAAQFRSPLLAGLRRLGTEWHRATIDDRELATLQVLHFPPFSAICPSHELAAFVRQLDNGTAPPGQPEFLENYRRMRQRPLAPMNGYPILVGSSMDGPLLVLEGYTRLCDRLSRVTADAPPEPIEVVIGICPRVQEWRLHDHANGAKLA
jgi:hypothetical protein